MSLLSILGKGLQTIMDEAMTPESFRIGESFEIYVRERLFIPSYYDLIERTHDYRANNHDYVEASMKPDFTFRDRWTKREFYVEAKFRSGEYNGKICWCNESQLKRYRLYDREKPMFVIIGIGENPKNPEFLSLIPLQEARYPGLFPSVIERFGIDLAKPVPSRVLWG